MSETTDILDSTWHYELPTGGPVEGANDFVLAWKLHENGCSVNFLVYDTYGWNSDGSVLLADDRAADSSSCSSLPLVGGHVWEGGLKWDGCLNFWKRDSACASHFCGPEKDPQLGRIMKAIYALGPKMERWDA